jgi:hypothetical protein
LALDIGLTCGMYRLGYLYKSFFPLHIASSLLAFFFSFLFLFFAVIGDTTTETIVIVCLVLKTAFNYAALESICWPAERHSIEQ